MRIALAYAQERRLYGRPGYALPVIREQLVKAHLDLLISECVTLPVTRALVIAPGRLSLWSSVVKYLVPVTADEVVAGMGSILGARSYLREGVADGIFQKLQRDHAIASIFEGTTHVNLQAVAHQLPFVLENRSGHADEPAQSELLTALFSHTEDTPAWAPDGRRLQLTNEGRDEITHSWDWIRRQVGDLTLGPDPAGVLRDLGDVLSEIDAMRARSYAAAISGKGDTGSTRALAVAADHCLFHAAASCLLTWLVNRDTLGGRFTDGRWLVLCLHRLVQRLRRDHELPETYLDAVEEPMLRSLDEDTVFSLLSLAKP
jgi:alkylation response protein AidB-like acyl-CoA dehydrogenase